MRKAFAVLCLIALPLILLSQEEPKFGIRFSGFVKTDILWDSRQTVNLREGHFLLYPKPELPDADGNDINAKASFNFLSIQTRLKGDITGPDALGAKTSGCIEGEFFGMVDGDINGFRLRHAFVKLNWASTELLVGQTWHPMFIASSFPEVVSFNTGTPFLIFARNPQIRVTQDIKHFRLIFTALSQIDFKSTGPDGPNTKYLRNSAIPSLNLNLEYSHKNVEEKKEVLVGVAGNFKRLVPELVTDSNYQTNEGINSLAGMAYLKLGFPKATFKLTGIYGQNMFDYTMIGGYAAGQYIENEQGMVTYRNFSTLSVWTEIMTNGKKMQGGLFLGWSKNMGTGDIISQNNKDYYARGFDIAHLYRISPRFIYNAGKFRIAPEIEYTVAAYGTPNFLEGSVVDPEPVGNIRFLIGVFYFF